MGDSIKDGELLCDTCRHKKTTWYLSGKVWRHPRWRISQSLAVPSSEPLTIRGGPLRAGQQLFTKDECSTIFFICNASERYFHARVLIMVFIYNCKWLKRHLLCLKKIRSWLETAKVWCEICQSVMWNPHKFSNDITPKRQTASSSYIAINRLNCIKPPEDLRRRNMNLLASDCIPCTHSFIRASRHNMCPITTPGKVHHSITMTLQYHVIFTIPLHIPQNCHRPKKK